MPKECNTCGNSFEAHTTEPKYKGEVLIKGIRCPHDYKIAEQAVRYFKSTMAATFLDKDSISVATCGIVNFRKWFIGHSTPYCKTWCHYDNGRIIVELEPIPK